MAYNYHGTFGLVALPGRSITTFPSGLVRVDRTYACRTERASVFRQQFAVGTILPFDDGTPAIDGLYIFPDAQETRKEDGFTEFKVSAYGRTNTTGQVSSTVEEGRFILRSTSQFPPATTFSQQSLPCVIELVTTKSVAFNTSPISEILPVAIPINVFVRQDGRFVKLEEIYRPGTVFFPAAQAGQSGSAVNITKITRITINPIIKEAPGTQFGTFREVIFTFSADAIVNEFFF